MVMYSTIFYALRAHCLQSFVYALYNLCDHPEYVKKLRKELSESSGEWWNCLDNLPLLDSFLKESARFHPSDSSK